TSLLSHMLNSFAMSGERCSRSRPRLLSCSRISRRRCSSGRPRFVAGRTVGLTLSLSVLRGCTRFSVGGRNSYQTEQLPERRRGAAGVRSGREGRRVGWWTTPPAERSDGAGHQLRESARASRSQVPRLASHPAHLSGGQGEFVRGD